jgi:hypothetical protein
LLKKKEKIIHLSKSVQLSGTKYTTLSLVIPVLTSLLNAMKPFSGDTSLASLLKRILMYHLKFLHHQICNFQTTVANNCNFS